MLETTFNPLAEPDQFIAVPRWSFSRMNRDQQAVYNTLLEQVDFATGIWSGTAYRIADATGLHLRVAQEILKWLHDEQYIKSFHRDGERRAYKVAIHGYQVRAKDSKWLGHRLDALATMEDETTRELHPEYVPTANTTANKTNGDGRKTKIEKGLKNSPPRTEPRTSGSDREPTASGTASPTASGTASPTANPPRVPHSRIQDSQEIQDRQDGQDAQDPSTSSTEKERDEFFDNIPAAVVGDAPSSVAGNGQGLSKEKLVAELRRLMKERFYPDEFLNTTKAHVERAFAKAKEVGQDTFLAAWFTWLETARRELRIPVGKEQDRRTGEERTRYEWRTWPLQYFLDSGAADRFSDEVRETRATLAGLLEAWRAEVAEEHGEDDTPLDLAANKGGAN